MKFKHSFLLVAITICFVTKSFSQKGYYKITNGFGIFGGITEVDIFTDNFITQKTNGFTGGLSATVDLPHKWYNLSYGMQFLQNKISILGRETASSNINEFLDYKFIAVQLGMLGHIKLFKSYLTLDVGPMIQYNSAFELEDKAQENYFINNYNNLTASEILQVSQFSVNGSIGITGGYKFIKLRAQYIYGLTNLFSKYNNTDLDTSGGESNFEGHLSILALGAMISF